MKPTTTKPKKQSARLKAKCDALLAGLASLSLDYDPGLSPEWYSSICEAGFRGIDSHTSVAVLCGLAYDNQPLTLRALMYRAVSVGLFPSTDSKWYDKTGRLVSRMRRLGLIPYPWIVDNLRSTQKPSSWSGLSDFADTVRGAYRKDFWANLPEYVHVLCEKDAVAGTVAPVTREFDVPLSPIRGYISDSFAFELGNHWKQIDKPIHIYYIGDYDPSGFDLERDAKKKLTDFAGKEITWTRLGVAESDFEQFGLIELAVKKTDKRWRKFVEQRGERCAEIDALPPPELRRRIKSAIESHVPQERWEQLKLIEAEERATFAKLLEEVA